MQAIRYLESDRNAAASQADHNRVAPDSTANQFLRKRATGLGPVRKWKRKHPQDSTNQWSTICSFF
jgi:hypothetical protein